MVGIEDFSGGSAGQHQLHGGQMHSLHVLLDALLNRHFKNVIYILALVFYL